MPRVINTTTVHNKTVRAVGQAPAVKPDPTVWAAALERAHGDASVLHVESRTVVWVGKPIIRKTRAPRKRGTRQ